MGDVADYEFGEPKPEPNNGPSMHDLVIKELESRRSFGLEKYGTLLQAHNGRRATKDALDEVLDLSVYLMQMLRELESVMLNVVITGQEGNVLGKLRIVRITGDTNSEVADYRVEVHVERGNDVVGVYTRTLFDFPRRSLNSVALLKAALQLFEAESLGLEDDIESDCPLRNEADSPNMVGRLERVVREIQAWSSGLHNH